MGLALTWMWLVARSLLALERRLRSKQTGSSAGPTSVSRFVNQARSVEGPKVEIPEPTRTPTTYHKKMGSKW
eukprot:1453103-Amphidinium_carterae.1